MGRVRLRCPHRVRQTPLAALSPYPPLVSFPRPPTASHYCIHNNASNQITHLPFLFYSSLPFHPSPLLLRCLPSSATQTDEYIKPADQSRRPAGVSGRRRAPADAGVRPLRRSDATEHGGHRAVPVPEMAGADAAPGEQLHRHRARRRDRRTNAGFPAAGAQLPAVTSEQGEDELLHGRHGRRRPRRRALPDAAAVRAAGRRVLRRGAGRAPDRAHCAQDAEDHRARQPDAGDRYRPVADRRLPHLLRPGRVAHHRSQRERPARRAQEPSRLVRAERLQLIRGRTVLDLIHTTTVFYPMLLWIASNCASSSAYVLYYLYMMDEATTAYHGNAILKLNIVTLHRSYRLTAL